MVNWVRVRVRIICHSVCVRPPANVFSCTHITVFAPHDLDLMTLTYELDLDILKMSKNEVSGSRFPKVEPQTEQT